MCYQARVTMQEFVEEHYSNGMIIAHDISKVVGDITQKRQIIQLDEDETIEISISTNHLTITCLILYRLNFLLARYLKQIN